LKRNGAPFLWNGCAVLAEYAKKRKIFDGIYDILNYKCFNIYFENNVPWRGTEINTTMIK
jgi:hypothetical protein